MPDDRPDPGRLPVPRQPPRRGRRRALGRPDRPARRRRSTDGRRPSSRPRSTADPPRAPDDDRWVLSTRTRPDGVVEIIVADASLKRIDHPFADRHAIVRMLAGDERWLPNAEEAAVLATEEEDLERRLDGHRHLRRADDRAGSARAPFRGRGHRPDEAGDRRLGGRAPRFAHRGRSRRAGSRSTSGPTWTGRSRRRSASGDRRRGHRRSARDARAPRGRLVRRDVAGRRADRRERPSGSAILYLLGPGDRSHWHRLDADEVWQYSGGDALELQVWADGDAGDHDPPARSGGDRRLGRSRPSCPQDAWQTAGSLGAWTLVGCIVTPAFEFDGFELAAPRLGATDRMTAGDGLRPRLVVAVRLACIGQDDARARARGRLRRGAAQPG